MPSQNPKRKYGAIAKFDFEVYIDFNGRIARDAVFGNSFLRISLGDPHFLFQIQIQHSLKIKWTKFHTNGVRKVDLEDLGWVHATRKAAFFRQVKLRSSRVDMETRELRSFTCLKKAAFLVA